ncbi:MAG: DUF1566 domain-containing protein [Thiolinea sp.]
MKKNSIFIVLLLTSAHSTLATAQYQPCRIGLIVATTPATQFHNNNDGTVTDLKTKLIWKKCLQGQTWQASDNTCIYETDVAPMFNWKEALEQASHTNSSGGFAGAVNWRLPNIKELSSIIENACYGPSINLEVFPNTPAGIFWSSTPYVGATEHAWSVRFNYGQNSMNFKYDYYFARLVRDPS